MRGAAFVPLLLLGGCASSSLLLLPDEGGGSGSVAVLGADGQETVVGQANSRTSLGAQPRTRAIDPARLSAQDRALVDGLPPPPARFTLYFVEGSTQIVPSSQPQLDALVEEVKKRPGAEVQVTGHTDRLGQEEDNDRLSMQRAQEVRDVLVAQGRLDAAITSVVGRGEREPLVPTADGVANPTNRRVEVIVR